MQPIENIEKMDERSRDIFQRLVADYIAHASPVGSRTLSRQIHSSLSPATIRNVLSDLEEMGLLAQPHTSAGRIPTPKGLRFYVDTLLEQRSLTDEEQSAIREKYDLSDKGVEALMQRTTKVLASISNYVGLVMTPRWEETQLKHIEFIPLSHGKLLGIFVSQDGRVENRVLDYTETLTSDDLERMNRYCKQMFVGLTLSEAQDRLEKELKETQQQYDQVLSRALFFSEQIFREVESENVFVEGESQLFHMPEFAHVGQVREVMDLLEERQKLLQALKAASEGPGVKVFIGSELPDCGKMNLSMIVSPYFRSGRVVGTLGVIGPTRMDYSRVVSIVDFTAKLVGDLL